MYLRVKIVFVLLFKRYINITIAGIEMCVKSAGIENVRFQIKPINSQ